MSIVLPTHNGSKFLRDSVQSCLEQTYDNLELVIVDDASSDGTGEIVDSLKDSRIRKIRHEKNRGLPAALNSGFSCTTGEYLTWTSDDNLYDKSAIDAMVELLEKRRDVDFVYSDFYLIDEDGTIVGEKVVRPPETLRESNEIGACFLYRRGVYERLGGYNLSARLAEDYEYWLRVHHEFRMAPLHRPLYYYRTHSGSLTGTFGEHAARRVVRRVARARGIISKDEYRRALAAIDVDEGFSRYRHGELRHARTLLLRGIASDLSWLKNRGVGSILLRSFGLDPRSWRGGIAHRARG